jgi:hypothetical protein
MNDELDKTEELFRALEQEVEGSPNKPKNNKIAILGDPNYGHLIIKYLQSLGGRNLSVYTGTSLVLYYIDEQGDIDLGNIGDDIFTDYTTLTYTDLIDINSQLPTPIKQVYFKGTHNVQQRKALISYLESLGFSNPRDF